MKKIVLSIALACAAPFAWAQVSETTTTTTTTDASGTITVGESSLEFAPTQLSDFDEIKFLARRLPGR